MVLKLLTVQKGRQFFQMKQEILSFIGTLALDSLWKRTIGYSCGDLSENVGCFLSHSLGSKNWRNTVGMILSSDFLSGGR